MRPDELAALPQIEWAAAAQFRGTPYPELADAELVSTEVDLQQEAVWVVVDAGLPVAHRICMQLDL